jgi:hypothetical protein
MPVLGDEKQVKITLPSSTPEEEAWVLLSTKMTAKDMLSMQTDAAGAETTWSVLAAAIKDWNFTDKEGNKSPITPENCSLIPSQDMVAITKALGFQDALDDAKKNL